MIASNISRHCKAALRSFTWTLCVVAAAVCTPAGASDAQLRVSGNTSTIELAPVLLTAERQHQGRVVVSNGGIPNLFDGTADVATNAETQALRQSVDNPNLRIIFTVSEGFYRILARRSAGIKTLADLRGKKIATVGRTSSAYYLHKMLGTVGLTERDVSVISMFPLNRIPTAMRNREIDAVTVWEPEIQNAADVLGEDAIEFQDRSIYRELFNLNTTAEALNDPHMRCEIVDYVRSLIQASEQVRQTPRDVWPLVAKSTRYDAKLIEKVWHHEGYPATLVSDLLDVLVEEDVWVAKEVNRKPRTRAQLATLIDTSVLKEAQMQNRSSCTGFARPASSGVELTQLQRSVDELAVGVDRAEALRAVKRLQHAYAHYYDIGQWSDVAALFTDHAVARESAKTITGKDKIRKHLTDTVGGGRTGLAEGQLRSLLFLSPVVTLEPDGKTAKGRWHVMKMIGEYGKSAQWEGGIYENEYTNDRGVWKISRENYHPQYEGPYESGWRNITRETQETAKPVPYHYDPARVGTPIPPKAREVAAGKREDFATLNSRLASLKQRAQRLTDISTVQNLQHSYGFYVDRKMWDDVADLFTNDGTMELGLQGVYVGKASIRRALNQFGPVALEEGEVNDHLQLNTVVTIAPDGLTAKTRGTQLRTTGVNNKSAQWGVDAYENTFVKQEGVWKLRSVHVYNRMTTDYYQGWARNAQPALQPNAEFPADRPPTETYESFPKIFSPAPHYTHPTAAAPAAAAASASRTAMELEEMLKETRRQVAIAEAYDASENVANAYGYYIDEFLWTETGDLFAQDGWKELSYIGTYVGHRRVTDSMIKRYGTNGRRPNSLAIHQKTQPVIHVAADGRSARIRTRLFQVNSSTDGDGSYIAGMYENQSVLENGVWKLQGMDLDYTWQTGYVAGWGKVNPSEARRFAPPTPALAKEYPPDRPLRGVIYAPFPQIALLAFHYRNPVSGREPPLLLP